MGERGGWFRVLIFLRGGGAGGGKGKDFETFSNV